MHLLRRAFAGTLLNVRRLERDRSVWDSAVCGRESSCTCGRDVLGYTWGWTEKLEELVRSGHCLEVPWLRLCTLCVTADNKRRRGDLVDCNRLSNLWLVCTWVCMIVFEAYCA